MSLIHSPFIIRDGLVMYLDAANPGSYPGSGNVWRDLSGNNNGTLINNPLFVNNGPQSYIRCGSNVTNAYVEVLDNASLDFGSNNFTVEYWFRKLQSTDGGYVNIWGVNKWNTGASPGTNEWALTIGNGITGNSDTTEFAIEVGNTIYITLYSTELLILNTWYQLVGMREGANLKLYINGVLKQSQSPSGLTSSSSVNNVGRNLRINNSNLNALYTNADNGNIKIYNRALTDAEVLQNYNALKWRYQL